LQGAQAAALYALGLVGKRPDLLPRGRGHQAVACVPFMLARILTTNCSAMTGNRAGASESPAETAAIGDASCLVFPAVSRTSFVRWQAPLACRSGKGYVIRDVPRCGGLGRQFLHLGGDDREPAASLARARRLDGRI
jgi:hypothetical protein